MSWAAAADDLAVAVREEFGVSVSYRCFDQETGELGAAVPVAAPFDMPSQAVTPGTSVPVTMTRPYLTVRLADLPAEPQEGDEATVAGQVWTVVDPQPDGHGSARLYLHKGSAS